MGVISPFQFVGHKIEKLLVEVPFGFDNKKSDQLNYFATYGGEFQKDKWVGSVTIAFRQMNKDNEQPTVLFEVVVVGRFIFNASDSDEDKNAFINFLKTSGAATVVPLARAAVASAGALCGSPDVCIIPNINVYNLKWTLPEAPEQNSEDKAE